jgi:hypothetical protein
VDIGARDRRADPRYALELPLRFLQAEALTRNLSESGVYFETTETFDLHQPIHFALVLGRAHPDERFVVECRGRVLRVDRLPAAAGVAARITSYRLIRSPLADEMELSAAVSVLDAAR